MQRDRDQEKRDREQEKREREQEKRDAEEEKSDREQDRMDRLEDRMTTGARIWTKRDMNGHARSLMSWQKRTGRKRMQRSIGKHMRSSTSVSGRRRWRRSPI